MEALDRPVPGPSRKTSSAWCSTCRRSVTHGHRRRRRRVLRRPSPGLTMSGRWSRSCGSRTRSGASREGRVISIARRLLRRDRGPLVGRRRHPDRGLLVYGSCSSCGARTPSDRPRRRRARLHWASILFNQTVNWLLRPSCPPRLRDHRVPVEIGRGSPLSARPSWGGPRRQEEVVDEIVLAATSLSSERTGPSSTPARWASAATSRPDRPRRRGDRPLVSIAHPDAARRRGDPPGELVAAAACFLP
jgi:hypothetical protein